MDLKRLARVAGLAALIIVAGLAGAMAGRYLKAGGSPPVDPASIPPSSLVAGTAFPDVPVVAPEGAGGRTGELLAGQGTAVLFLRLDCAPCGDMVTAWQSAIDSGELDGVPVIGITFDPPAEIAAYRSERGLTFPVYQDPERIFLSEHGVRAVPLIVLVDPSGTIVPGGTEMRNAVDGDALRTRLAKS